MSATVFLQEGIGGKGIKREEKVLRTASLLSRTAEYEYDNRMQLEGSRQLKR